jgi:hypothetical protein
MAHAASNGGSYGVHFSGAVRQSLLIIQHRPSEQGRGEAVLTAFRQAIRRLTQDPTNFGEPLYRLPALRMQIRSGVIGPLVIHFAVSEERPLVFIKGAELLAEK